MAQRQSAVRRHGPGVVFHGADCRARGHRVNSSWGRKRVFKVGLPDVPFGAL